MSRPLDRRTFLKGIAVLAAAAPAAALAADPGVAADPAAADSTATAAPKAAPAAPATYGPDFSICRNDEERALLERQYASALELVATIRKAHLPPGIEPVTAFAALARTKPLVAPATPPVPAPGTPRPEDPK